MVIVKDCIVDIMHLITQGILIDSAQIGLLSLGQNIAGYMAGIRVLLENGGLLGMDQTVAGYAAVRVLPLEDGIGAGSLVGILVVGIFPLIFGSFVG